MPTEHGDQRSHSGSFVDAVSSQYKTRKTQVTTSMAPKLREIEHGMGTKVDTMAHEARRKLNYEHVTWKEIGRYTFIIYIVLTTLTLLERTDFLNVYIYIYI